MHRRRKCSVSEIYSFSSYLYPSLILLFPLLLFVRLSAIVGLSIHSTKVVIFYNAQRKKRKKLKILGNAGRNREDFRRLSVKPVPTYKESLRAKRQCRQASRRLSSAVGEAGADVQGKSESEAAMPAGIAKRSFAVGEAGAKLA